MGSSFAARKSANDKLGPERCGQTAALHFGSDGAHGERLTLCASFPHPDGARPGPAVARVRGAVTHPGDRDELEQSQLLRQNPSGLTRREIAIGHQLNGYMLPQ